MGERLSYVIDVPADAGARPIPPMMLISLVENAVKHGIDPLADGGRIEVSAEATPDRTRVVVRDTGIGLSGHTGLGIGLANIRERLATLHGADACLDLAENVPRGVVAAIEWPTARA
jgi:LytS/YehU family sensor histidine kinase